MILKSKKRKYIFFEKDFLNVIAQKVNISVHNSGVGAINYLNLDLSNWLNVMIASG